jgi:multiple sugar transport system permease protein
LKVKNIIKKILIYIPIFILLVIFLFPIYWMIVSSFKDKGLLMKLPPDLTPIMMTFDNYKDILSSVKYLTYMKNSLIVSLSTVLICMVVSLLASYSLSRFQFPLRKTIMSVILSIQMFPIVAILISLFTFYSKLDLINTYTGLILADTTISLPLAIWMLKSFYDTIPKSLDESACIDGCGRLRTMVQIIIPLIKPGMLAVGIYTFLKSWDDFMFSLVLMTKDMKKTLPVGIAESFLGEYSHDYGGMMTLAVIASLPIIILFILFQKNMIFGLTGGAVKE